MNDKKSTKTDQTDKKSKKSKKLYDTASNVPSKYKGAGEVMQYKPQKGFFKMDLRTKQTFTNPQAWADYKRKTK